MVLAPPRMVNGRRAAGAARAVGRSESIGRPTYNHQPSHADHGPQEKLAEIDADFENEDHDQLIRAFPSSHRGKPGADNMLRLRAR
jgi:hypothetical protein